MRRERRWLGILGLSVWLGIAHAAGCSDSGGTDDDKSQVSSLVELGIDDGASEGVSAEAVVPVDKETTLSLKTGAEVKIAAGSTTKELVVTLSRPPDKQALEFVKSTDKKIASAPYVITPHRQVFEKQVEVTLPVSGQVNTDKAQVIYLADEKDRDWKVAGKPQVSAGKAKIMVDHFSVLLVVEEESSRPVAMPTLDGGGVGMAGDVCARCPEGQVCGGDGLCVPPPTACARVTCHPEMCGEIDDGCGGTLNCGECPEGLTCGGDGVPNRCSGGSGCGGPTACATGACGQLPDGCGGFLDCGECPEGLTCGGDGTPNVCGAGPGCDPLACATGACGQLPDGCGDFMDCGECPGDQTCGGGGVPNVCGTGSTCVPLTCGAYSADCGYVADGCGGLLNCGSCPVGSACAVVEANKCGVVDPCSPLPAAVACADKCGTVDDGCGGTYECTSGNGGIECSAPTWCGGSGVPNECGGPAA